MRRIRAAGLPVSIVFVGFALAGLFLAGTPTAAIAAAGETYTFELPFPAAEPWVPEQLSWPATVLVVRAELGKATATGRRVKVIPRIANGSYEDVKVTVEIALLDADGNVVFEDSETDGLEEEELSPFSFRFEVPQQAVETIERCRIVVRAKAK